MATHPTAMPDHLPPPPRAVRLRADRGLPFQGVLELWPAAALALLFFVLLGWLLSENLVTAWYGELVEGQVVAAHPGAGKSSGSAQIQFAYRFDGQEYRQQFTVPAEAIGAWPPGTPVAVRVWASDPGGRFYREGTPWVEGTLLLAFLGVLVLNALVAATGISMMAGEVRHRRLLREGAVAAGAVTAVVSSRGRPPRAVLEFTYTSPGPGSAGELAPLPHSGRQTIPPQAAATFRAGDPVTVLYDPERPAVAVAYEAGRYEVYDPSIPAPPPPPPPEWARSPYLQPGFLLPYGTALGALAGSLGAALGSWEALAAGAAVGVVAGFLRARRPRGLAILGGAVQGVAAVVVLYLGWAVVRWFLGEGANRAPQVLWCGAGGFAWSLLLCLSLSVVARTAAARKGS